MKLSHFACVALLASVTLTTQQALALSEDDKTMSTPGGAPRFSDPDEQTPTGAVYLGGSTTGGAVDPSSVRYDYDPASGSFVPHRN